MGQLPPCLYPRSLATLFESVRPRKASWHGRHAGSLRSIRQNIILLARHASDFDCGNFDMYLLRQLFKAVYRSVVHAVVHFLTAQLILVQLDIDTTNFVPSK